MTKPPGRVTAPGTTRLDLPLLAPVLLGFWCLYFAIVTLSNLTDLLRSIHVLPADWAWISGNLAFIATSTAKISVPAGLSSVLLAGVIVWQSLASILFWRALRRGDRASMGPAFVVSLSLWATFILLDEILLIFETGAEATHLRLFIAELVSLCVLQPGGIQPDAKEGPLPAG
jgi:hypothetical protein